MDFWDRLDEVRERWDVLRHPFYLRWSSGELTRAELAHYSGEYRHAVVALAEATEHAAVGARGGARGQLAAHAAEERAHVALWDRFVAAVGGDADREPAAETRACAEAWADAERGELPTLVALYAIESAQPAISATKRDGLVERYGFAPESAGTAYFDLHAELDVEHAADGRAMIEPRLADADREALLAEAERVLRANWELLDGVEAAAG